MIFLDQLIQRSSHSSSSSSSIGSDEDDEEDGDMYDYYQEDDVSEEPEVKKNQTNTRYAHFYTIRF